MSLVCMIGTRQPIDVLFPMESHLFCSQLSLVAYSSLCRLRPHRFLPVQFVMSISAVLYSSSSGCHVEGKMCMSNITRKQNLTAKSWYHCLYNLSSSSSSIFPESQVHKFAFWFIVLFCAYIFQRNKIKYIG